MKKKNDMARECAERLKPFKKTIADATDFYIRHLKRKKSTGRTKGSGRYSGIPPDMNWSDLRKRFEGDQFTTRVLDLFEMAIKQRPAQPPSFAGLPCATDELKKQRRAEQAHIKSQDEMKKHRRKRDATATAYEHFLEHSPVPGDLEGDERKQEIQKRFATFLLTPAGKFTGAMASDIYNELDKCVVWVRKGRAEVRRLKVENRIFTSKGRVMEAIHDIAKRLHFGLHKQH